VQVIVPEPPPAPVVTAAPKPTAHVRFNGSFAVDGAYTALIEETSQGQTATRRWHQGDTVLGGYRVIEIGLRTLKLRWGGETILLSAGTTQDLERRSEPSGLSAIAPEPIDTGLKARPAMWHASPAATPRAALSAPLASPLSSVTPVPETAVVQPPAEPTAADDAAAGSASNLPLK
jgi:hypothetical protein